MKANSITNEMMIGRFRIDARTSLINLGIQYYENIFNQGDKNFSPID
jgi:hypothetical protein